ncbi:MAG: hypothetical protein RL037_1515 [Bacteroidota bacterium]
MLKKTSLLILLLSFPLVSISQDKKANFVVRYLNKFINDTTDKSKPQTLVYPTVAYAPETKWEFGASAVVVGYAKKDTNNRLSEIYGFTFFTTEKQYGGLVEHALYSNKNKWFFLGKLKVQSFPLSYHGIGANSPKEKIAVVEALSFNWKERFLRKVWSDFYIGLELDFQRLSRVNFRPSSADVSLLTPQGYQGSNNLGVGIGLLYDNRHNVLNVRDGFFAETALITYSKGLGSITDFSSIFTDFRYFRPIGKNNVLAIQSLGQFTIGDAPFNQYALMGGEMMMRGYYLGRFRDKNFISLQTEYRMLPLPFAKKFGFAVFASSGVIYDKVSMITPQYFKYAGGAGIHYLLFPKKDVWTRVDFAINNEGGTGFYLFIGCAF